MSEFWSKWAEHSKNTSRAIGQLSGAFILKVLTRSSGFQYLARRGFHSLRAGRHEHSLVKKEEVS